jgi:cytochrome c-type biogenesis protein CcmH/NrfF
VLAALAAAAALALPAVAAADCPRTSVGDVEDEVMCPVCGTPLALATEAPQAQREREYIERLIAQCKSKSEVKQALVAQFGDRVLALPGDQKDDDFGDVLAYAIPALAVLLGLSGIALAARRWRRRPSPAGESPAAAGPSDKRLEDDLERYDL